MSKSGKYREFTARVRDVNLHVGHWPGKGPAVICVHGLTANHLSFALVGTALQAAGFDVYAPDLRGRGRSDKPQGDYSLDVHGEDILGLVDHLKLKSYVLVGHSLGAAIAVRLGARDPRIAGMALLDGGALLSFAKKLKILAVVKPSLNRLGRTFPDAESYITMLSGGQLFDPADPLVRDHLHYELEEVPGGVRCNIPRHVIESEVQSQGGSLDTGKLLLQFLLHPLRQLRTIKAAAQIPYEAIACPVLVLKAGKPNLKPGDDLLPLDSLDAMLKRIANGKSQVFPTLNHYDIILTPNAERDAALVDFLSAATRKK